MGIPSFPEGSSLHAAARPNQKIVTKHAEATQQSNSKAADAQQHQAEMASQQRIDNAQQAEKKREKQQENFEKLVQRLDEFIATFDIGLSFRVDEKSGKNVVTVYEASSGDVIRQYPEQEMLNLAQKLADYAGGLVDERV